MKKTYRKSRKNQTKMLDYIFGGILALALILIVALIIANQLGPDPSDYVITADGHVHTADGTHVGTYDEMFGEGYEITEDGHVHAADGTHVGTYEEPSATEEATDQAEDEGN